MLRIVKESILDVDADIIVMSANPSLLAGSGVSGVIHKAAGPELEQYAKSFAPLAEGQAILTPAFNLKANYVVHTVCPRFYDGHRGEQQGLQDAYLNALAVCNELDRSSTIAFVAMGTGVYKWPIEDAADIAIGVVSRSKFKQTLVCIQDNRIISAFTQAMVSRL